MKGRRRKGRYNRKENDRQLDEDDDLDLETPDEDFEEMENGSRHNIRQGTKRQTGKNESGAQQHGNSKSNNPFGKPAGRVRFSPFPEFESYANARDESFGDKASIKNGRGGRGGQGEGGGLRRGGKYQEQKKNSRQNGRSSSHNHTYGQHRYHINDAGSVTGSSFSSSLSLAPSLLFTNDASGPSSSYRQQQPPCAECLATTQHNSDFARRMLALLQREQQEVRRWADEVAVGDGSTFEPMEWQPEAVREFIPDERRVSQALRQAAGDPVIFARMQRIVEEKESEMRGDGGGGGGSTPGRHNMYGVPGVDRAGGNGISRGRGGEEEEKGGNAKVHQAHNGQRAGTGIFGVGAGGEQPASVQPPLVAHLLPPQRSGSQYPYQRQQQPYLSYPEQQQQQKQQLEHVGTNKSIFTSMLPSPASTAVPGADPARGTHFTDLQPTPALRPGYLTTANSDPNAASAQYEYGVGSGNISSPTTAGLATPITPLFGGSLAPSKYSLDKAWGRPALPTGGGSGGLNYDDPEQRAQPWHETVVGGSSPTTLSPNGARAREDEEPTEYQWSPEKGRATEASSY